jgi:putative endonuclease
MPWYVYLLRLQDGHICVGLTADLERRLSEHRSGHGCATTAESRSVDMIHVEIFTDRAAAAKRERQLKRWSRAKKLALAGGRLGQLHSPALAILRDLAHVGNRLFATGSDTTSVFSVSIWEIDVATGHATRLGSVNLGLSGGGLFGIPPLSKLTISVASVSIKFPSLIGTTYQVQYRSPRTLDIWTDLGERIPGTGNEISVLDSALDDSHRTYRLQMFP